MDAIRYNHFNRFIEAKNQLLSLEILATFSVISLISKKTLREAFTLTCRTFLNFAGMLTVQAVVLSIHDISLKLYKNYEENHPNNSLSPILVSIKNACEYGIWKIDAFSSALFKIRSHKEIHEQKILLIALSKLETLRKVLVEHARIVFKGAIFLSCYSLVFRLFYKISLKEIGISLLIPAIASVFFQLFFIKSKHDLYNEYMNIDTQHYHRQFREGISLSSNIEFFNILFRCSQKDFFADCIPDSQEAREAFASLAEEDENPDYSSQECIKFFQKYSVKN